MFEDTFSGCFFWETAFENTPWRDTYTTDNKVTINGQTYAFGVESETGTFSSSYTNAEEYAAFAESLGFTVLTMEEYNSSYEPEYLPSGTGGAYEWVYHPGDFSYKKIALPYGVTGEDSTGKFEYNTTITDVLLPNTMTKIGSSMFSSCPELKCVYIPGSVKEIDGWAFYRM